MRFYAVPSMPPRRSSDSTAVVMPIYATAEEYIRIREYERHCQTVDRSAIYQDLRIIGVAFCFIALLVFLIYLIVEKWK